MLKRRESTGVVLCRPRPVEYRGGTLYLADQIPVGKMFRAVIRLLSAHSRYPKIIKLGVNKGGYLLCGGKKGQTTACMRME